MGPEAQAEGPSRSSDACAGTQAAIAVWGSTGDDRPEGCPEGKPVPFATTVGSWQRLITPAAFLRSGVVRSRVPTVVGRAPTGFLSTFSSAVEWRGSGAWPRIPAW